MGSEEERWRRIALVFDQAVSLSPEGRSAFLDGACDGDDDLRQRVASLLESSDRASGFLERPFPLNQDSIPIDGPSSGRAPAAAPSADTRTQATSPLASAAERIGPYRLIERIGEGGMGEVWRAEQSAPIRRKVALKLIKSGMDTRRVVARFEGERQALAFMDHPSIARVYDAGETPRGHPYFVMELVEGVPITEYCDRQRLTLRERLDLFRQVCEGVQHAHHRGIIHRDLKPSNILVAVENGRPAPKIIDFGVAKATTAQLTDKHLHTELGMIIGTPEYMSPEQAEMTAAGVDTRTDVYSLGVVLYELLTGTLPFDSRQMREASFDEIRRRIREEEPPRPSTRVSTLRERLSAIAERRRTEPGRLISRLRGELDWIVLRAMEKDRARRYGSPGELAADIERSLRNEPVLAGPPGVLYRARKFVRRHRAGVVVASTAVTGLLAFAITTSVQSARIAKERDRANREAQASQRVSDFLVGMFQVADPGVSQGQTITAREILDQGAERVGKDLSPDPLVQARLMLTIGLVYENLGLYKDAEPFLEKALDARRRLLGPEHPDTLMSTHAMAEMYLDTGRLPAAEKLAREALEARSRVLGEDDRTTLATTSLLGRIYTESGRPRAAADLLEKTLGARSGLLEVDDPVTLDLLISLTSSNLQLGRYAAAEGQSRAALERELRRSPKENLFTLASRQRTGLLCFLQGKYEDARTIYLEGFEISNRMYGPDIEVTLQFEAGLVATSFFLANREEALAAEGRLLQTGLRVLGPDHPFALQQLFALGMMNGLQGRYPQAEEYFRQASDGFRRLSEPEGYNTLWAQKGLAVAALHNGKPEEAEKILEAVVEASPRTLGPEHPHTRDAMRHLAEVYAAQQRDAEAEKLYKAALAEVPPETWQDPRTQSGALFGLAALEAGRGERTQALDHLRQAVARGFDDPAALSRNPRFESVRSDPGFAALKTAAEANSRRPPAAPTL